MLSHLDMNAWVTQLGYIGLFAIIFIETGLFVGFFLPGDSLVVAAGFLSAHHVFKITVIAPLLTIAAILGYAVAYYLGRYLSRWLLRLNDHWWFKKRYLKQAAEFYQKHGGMALVIGRFLPIIRTFVPIVAGMAAMSVRRYMFYNVLGGFLWGGVLSLIGYALGRLIPDGERYFLPLVLFIIVISVLPVLWQVFCYVKKNRSKK